MSSPVEVDEDEVEGDVEFVSEATARPVLDFIELMSDSDEEGSSTMAETIEDEVDRHKAHVVSTLDRLARQVEIQKQERANKCRAFKAKLISQKAHGQGELAAVRGNTEAKRCVDMWLNMPGVRPGVINTGAGRRFSRAFPQRNGLITKQTCPVVNCRRVYDNGPLLDGHLKRFDHSPCDPTIYLKGSPSELFACVACGLHFTTKEAWKLHLQSKISSSNAEGHTITQTRQVVVCFACPTCYLLFNLRDECLQHMSAKNHFTDSITMKASKERALPVPIPRYAKNRLVALCKDVPFSVRCTICRKILPSHQAAQAHFNVSCNQGCAIAVADKTVVEIMKRLQVQGQCSLCCKMFFTKAEIERHNESTQHKAEVNQTMNSAILQYSSFSEIQLAKKAKERAEIRLSSGLETAHQKKGRRDDSEGSPAKRQRHCTTMNGSSSRGSNLTLAWFCECGQQFPEEDIACKHLLAINQIFHQCGVCDKLMSESAITNLHMSRFHGGAHLSNFFYHCRKCKVDMPRYEDILLHVSVAHRGHTYITEREAQRQPIIVTDAKQMAGEGLVLAAHSQRTEVPSTAGIPTSSTDEKWMCRMCEDIFDSEADVHKHCSDLNSHNFQRFVCGHCTQKFFKESTMHRHCKKEHGGQIEMSYFCGLCDSMQFESEGEFLEHFKNLHSKDYYHMEEVEVSRPAAAENEGESESLCPCMGTEKSKEERKAAYTQCMRNIATEGKCQYVCSPCGVSVSSFAQIKTHVHTKHTALKLEKTFDVECTSCWESFMDVPSFHEHHHSKHCLLAPCCDTSGSKKKAGSTAVKILNADEIKPGKDGIADQLAKSFNVDNPRKDGDADEDESDEELKQALALSQKEEKESAAELEEVLKRSILDF